MNIKETEEVLHCTGCGAKLIYNFATHANKCEYCGNAYKIKAGNKPVSAGSKTSNAGCIPFKRDITEVKSKLLHWIIEGDQTPTDILSADFELEKAYFPLWYFEGKYKGHFNALNKKGKVDGADQPLSGAFSIYAYGGKAEEEGSVISNFVTSIDKSLIVPFDDVETDGVTLNKIADRNSCWNTYGNLSVANSVYVQLSNQYGKDSSLFKHYLTYELEAANAFYLPCWSLSCMYGDTFYDVYMDDISGKIIGERPVEQYMEPPLRAAIFKKYALVGLGLWFGMLIVRAFLAAIVGGHFNPYDNYYNNILFSEGAGLYWLLRGALFLLVLPAVMAIIFYPNMVNKFYRKRKETRIKDLDLILTGRKPEVF
ncbi:hypothetical protein ABDD95_16320 [Mucilaginibacter sp. PAMB04274]|uniref:hypothetical protein n=1 Tax=Mucilaginibacter sp. PAMB04274 TaxID=3138568 RepID=UPI0031F6EDD7